MWMLGATASIGFIAYGAHLCWRYQRTAASETLRVIPPLVLRDSAKIGQIDEAKASALSL